MDKILEKFKSKIDSKDFVYGVFTKSSDPMISEILGIANFDFVILDTEHGPLNVNLEQENVRAALLRGLVPIIRTSDISAASISKAFDIGAVGVQVPEIESADQARQVVKLSKFYPYGERGVCRFVRAANYSAMDRKEFFENSKDLLVILQIEGLKGIENLDSILDVPGIDVIFIGPYDLSASLGVPGEIKHPRVLHEMMKIIEKAKERRIAIGTFTDDFEMVEKWKKLGVQYISYYTDAGLFYETARDSYNKLKSCGQAELKAKVLDVTLRDGGYINEWNFGLKNKKKIQSLLEESDVDYIECGFLQDGSFDSSISKYGTIQEANKLLPRKSLKNYVLMANYGKVDFEKLPDYCGYGVKFIRVTFHKEDMLNALKAAEVVKAKGYKVMLQPMVTNTYTDSEFEYLIKRANLMKPYAVYVVDSFGTMKRNDVLHYFKLLERLLDDDILLGFHSHNNLQLAFSNAITLLDNSNRNFILDSSVYGMGRGAGNLNTELILQHLNTEFGSKYNIKPVLEIMDSVLNKIHQKTPWGYSLPNYLSAEHNCHPNYAKFLVEKNNLTLKQMDEIFSMIESKKKNEYDKNYIESLYLSYLSSMKSTENDFEKVKVLFDGKEIVVVAPGKSSQKHINEIQEMKQQGKTVVSVNFAFDDTITDYIFMGNIRRMSQLDKEYSSRVIASSNIPDLNVFAKVDYSSLLNSQEGVEDNSGFMLLKLLKQCHAKSICVYGMDEYKYDSAENYSSNELELVNSEENIDKLNFGLNILKKEYEAEGVVFVK